MPDTALPPGPRAPAAVNTYRLAQRPLESLIGWRRRYGDVFTVRLLIFGTGVYVADPKAIRELFTGDQSDLHAGEANAPLSAVLGATFVAGDGSVAVRVTVMAPRTMTAMPAAPTAARRLDI